MRPAPPTPLFVEPDRDWIVTAGLTRRLVKAPTLYAAQTQFIELGLKGEIPGILKSTRIERGDVKIREATEVDLIEFAPKRRRPVMDGQLGLGFDVPIVKRKRTADDGS